ncbi:MAG TPA: 16S rRNA (cytosine(967)-C(5))-methyltransferase RsmB [Feifaniaceae bacterium]|nr:16S rRNA (cytosine(967)-C(5))-methyltransferase RsmB [Feifaniaceae bacterium]
MNPRKYSLDALCDVTDRGAYANLRVKQLSRDLPQREAKHAAALVYTTLDHLLTIDYYLSHFVEGTQKPVIRGILRLGVCELLYFSTPAHAAVSESVQLTREVGKPALSGFVNAVLRRVEREREHLPAFPQDPLRRLSIQYSYPEWIVADWMQAYGETETEALLSRPAAKVEVRAQYPFTTAELIRALPVESTVNTLDINSVALEKGFDVASDPLFLEGKYTVMGQGAMLVCRALGNVRGKLVLDACAAPGGKSAYLSSLFENDIHLTCFELHEHRIELLDRTLERLRVSAQTLQKDAAVFDPAFTSAFDAVLLDAPCSGLGLLGDKPDIRYSKSDADIVSLVSLQKSILETCCRYVAPGGILVYATCTISSRENERMIDWFLNGHPEFTLEAMPLPLENDGKLQLLPHRHGTDVFFISRMRKCI